MSRPPSDFFSSLDHATVGRLREDMLRYMRRSFSYLEQSHDDIVNQAFLNVHRLAHSYVQQLEDPYESRKVFMYKAVHSAAINHMRRRENRIYSSLEDLTQGSDGSHWEPADCRDPESCMSERELSPAIETALSRLPMVYKETLILHYVEGLTTEQIGRRIGSPQMTVLTRLRRGRAKLLEYLPQSIFQCRPGAEYKAA